MTATISATPEVRASFAHQMRSEWIKLSSLRSTWWVGAIAVAVMLLFAVTSSAPTDDGKLLAGLTFGFVILGILGVTTATGEWSGNLMIATLAATPNRTRWLLAKAATVAVFVFVVELVAVLLSAAALLAMSSMSGETSTLLTVPALRLVIGAAVAMACAGVLGVAIGVAVRHTGASVIIVLALLIAPLIGPLFGNEALARVASYLPTSAWNAILGAHSAGLDFFPLPEPVGLVLAVAWLVLPMLGAWALLRRRDA